MATGKIPAAKRRSAVADYERLSDELDVPTEAVIQFADRIADARDVQRDDVMVSEVCALVAPEWSAQVWRTVGARCAVDGMAPEAAEALTCSIEHRTWSRPGERCTPTLTLFTGRR